jgi:hypothetical protein
MKSWYKLALIVLVVGGVAAVTFSGSRKAESASGTVTYTYDSVGRIVQDVYPANSAAYQYDNAGNRTADSMN